jgi:hypothetical protein
MLLPQYSRFRTPLQKIIVASLAVLVLAAFATLVYSYERYYRGPPKVPDRDKQEEDIAEAVFRYQFLHNASGRQQSAEVYFLSLRYRNPSEEFMQRFAGNTPVISTVSECTEDDDIRDLHTDARGILFRITTIKWITPSRVEVSGGYDEVRLSSSGDTYYVEKRDGKWVVVRDKMHWIS